MSRLTSGLLILMMSGPAGAQDIVVEDENSFYPIHNVNICSDRGIYLSTDPEMVFTITGVTESESREVDFRMFDRRGYVGCGENWQRYSEITENGYIISIPMPYLLETCGNDGSADVEMRVSIDGSSYRSSSSIKVSLPTSRKIFEPVVKKGKRRK